VLQIRALVKHFAGVFKLLAVQLRPVPEFHSAFAGRFAAVTILSTFRFSST
jgi:hypothetical protein